MDKLKWDEFLRWLNRLLAGEIYKGDNIRSIAKAQGFPVLSVNFDTNPRNAWFNILDYYVRNYSEEEAKEKIQSYIKQIIKDSAETPDLKRALEWSKPKLIDKELNEEEYESKVGKVENLEVLMKEKSSFLPSWYFEVGSKVSKAVGYIEVIKPNGTEVGTGFLLKDNYVLTNNHVIENREQAESAFIEFNYEKSPEGGEKKKDKYLFDISSERYFATSKDDDWTIVKLTSNANEHWGQVEINAVSINKLERASIIQHPGGDPKQIGIHNNIITYVDDDLLMYLTDTLPGSSGSPVFNKNWELIGLHREGGYLREPNTKSKVYRNAGTNINKVLRGIQAARIDGF